MPCPGSSLTKLFGFEHKKGKNRIKKKKQRRMPARSGYSRRPPPLPLPRRKVHAV